MIVGIGCSDPADEFASITFAGADDRFAIFNPEYPFARVESEFGLACLFIRSMAKIAFVGKDGAHVPIEIDIVGRTGGDATARHRDEPSDAAQIPNQRLAHEDQNMDQPRRVARIVLRAAVSVPPAVSGREETTSK